MKKIAVLIWTCIILTGCKSNPKVDVSTEAKAIRSIENQWTVALQNKDIDKILSIYSDDAVVMKPDKAIYVGAKAIREQVESDWADTTLIWSSTTTTIDLVEVSASGDLAYARGINRTKMKTQTGFDEISDKWIDIYKKINGQWKCVTGIWNSNKP